MKIKKIKLPFGLDNLNSLIHIADVDTSKKHAYFCPSCKSLLIPAKGKINQHHFRHKSTQECEGALESAIHLAAKTELLKRKQITLPQYIITESAVDTKDKVYTEKLEIIPATGKTILFDLVQEEQEIHGMRADILAEVAGNQLIIEIYYRHRVDDPKLNKIIKDAKISAIEVDLSDLTTDDVKDVESFWLCLNDPSRIKWLHNAKDNSSLRSPLKEKLANTIKKQELIYINEETIKLKEHQLEENKLIYAIKELKKECSEENILTLKNNATEHSAWKRHSSYRKFTIDNLPDFLNVEVANGDWIFGCDRRVWQTAIYSHFICLKANKFSIKMANDWLNNTAMCKTPSCTKIIGIYQHKHRDLVNTIPGRLPSSWRTLHEYLWHLFDIGILEFTGEDYRKPGNEWFKVISKTPTSKSYTSIINDPSGISNAAKEAADAFLGITHNT